MLNMLKFFCLDTCTRYIPCDIRTSLWFVKHKTFCVGSTTSNCVWIFTFEKFAVIIIAGFWVFIRYCTTRLGCETFWGTFSKTICVKATKRDSFVLVIMAILVTTPSIISHQGYSLIYLQINIFSLRKIMLDR